MENTPGLPNENPPDDPLIAEQVELPYTPWLASDEELQLPGEYDSYAVELLVRAHEWGVIRNSDIPSLPVGVPELAARLYAIALEKGFDVKHVFKGFDIFESDSETE